MVETSALIYAWLQPFTLYHKDEFSSTLKATLPHVVKGVKHVVFCQAKPALHCLLQLIPVVQQGILQELLHWQAQHHWPQLTNVWPVQVTHLEFG